MIPGTRYVRTKSHTWYLVPGTTGIRLTMDNNLNLKKILFSECTKLKLHVRDANTCITHVFTAVGNTPLRHRHQCLPSFNGRYTPMPALLSHDRLVSSQQPEWPSTLAVLMRTARGCGNTSSNASSSRALHVVFSFVWGFNLRDDSTTAVHSGWQKPTSSYAPLIKTPFQI